ncbi:MAG: hypothetical protein ABIW79_02655 [Gemmatimonas sp.]
MSSQNSKSQNFVRIDLTPDQQAKVMETTGKDVQSIELSTQELEERIAPMQMLDLE